MEMPLFIKIDFRKNGHLGAWWTREDNGFQKINTTIDQTSIRGVLIALADELDPEAADEKEDK